VKNNIFSDKFDIYNNGSPLSRPVIEQVSPIIGNGRYPIKRVIGEKVSITATIFSDSHDLLAARILYKHDESSEFLFSPLKAIGNDVWIGEFKVDKIGAYLYNVEAWVDYYETWLYGFIKKAEANLKLEQDVLIGISIIEKAIKRGASNLEKHIKLLKSAKSHEELISAASDLELRAIIADFSDLKAAARYYQNLRVIVEREKALFSSWYEVFPRSLTKNKKHGTFKDCEKFLKYVSEMGFDVLYFPPIHPIGITFRKGKNNSLIVEKGDPGCPWAIGNSLGGHKTIHPELGDIKDFQNLVKKASKYGIEIAIDLAFQCSVDNPYLKEHREWFSYRPDGSIQYAENPPKKYEDIVPFNFETEDWKNLWYELKSIVEYWIDKGVKIFRVDNPHTKSFRFWGWLINEIRLKFPDVIFLSEAFTRPNVMYHLAKIGFSQSYTYFTWRFTADEIKAYLKELTETELKEYFRPNFWPNTPDILMSYFQEYGKEAFITRLILAATLSSNYGIYGPPFELCVNKAREKGSEEYLNSEKYEIASWNINSPTSIKPVIALVNSIRKNNRCLQSNRNLYFHDIEAYNMLCYSKSTDEKDNVILVAVNMNYGQKNSGVVNLNLDVLGITHDETFKVKDLLNGNTYYWRGNRNYIELGSHEKIAHIFLVSR